MEARPRIFVVNAGTPDRAACAEAAKILRGGGLVAFPTETVYGLGADVTNTEAIARLDRVKGRPPDKPYSWHLPSVDHVRRCVPSLSPIAARLMERFWPGPLTVVLPTSEGRTTGFRVPDHPVARRFLEACGVPVAAPSANRSGEPPATDAAGVVAGLNGQIDALLDGGPTRLGRESTVIELCDDRLEVLRDGAIARDVIFQAIRDLRAG